jgi:hypothetical protein
MKSSQNSLRNHMLAATMADRWETLNEIAAVLRKQYGMIALRSEVQAWLGELAKDGIHTLAHRRRDGLALPVREYRLYVNPGKIGTENRAGD